MATTFIDTKACPRVKLSGGRGEVAEIVNRERCGARNVLGMLRWLAPGERFEAEPLGGTCQLIYLMDGRGVIRLASQDYEVAKGAGIFLGPSETAAIRSAEGASVKLLHLIVPHIDDDARPPG